MDGFAALEVHPDIVEGLESLSELGIRLVTLSNGSASVAAERLLDGAGIADKFERLLSVEDAGGLEAGGRRVRLRSGRVRRGPDGCDARGGASLGLKRPRFSAALIRVAALG